MFQHMSKEEQEYHRVRGNNSLVKTKYLWEKHKTIGYASDLIGKAIIMNKPRAGREAAEWLLSGKVSINHLLKELAESCLSACKANEDDKGFDVIKNIIKS